MTKEDSEKNPRHNPEMPLSISENLGESIVEAVNSLPEERTRLEAIDLLLAIATGEGKGADILKVMTQDKHPQFLGELKERAKQASPSGRPAGELTINGKSVEYSYSIEYLLERSWELSGGKPVATDHIVLADTGRITSLLEETLKKVDVCEPTILSVEEIAKRVVYQEKPAKLESFSLSPRQVDISPEIPPRRRLDFLPISRTTDLIAEAREGKFSDVIIRPKWAADLLNSLETQSITLFVSDQEEGADTIVMGLANQLEKDKEGVFSYQKIIMIDPASLEKNPQAAIQKALNLARDGVLYLPELQRYLQLTPLRIAIAEKKVKIITSFSEKQWHKVQDDFPFERIRPIFPEPPTVSETIEIIKAKREELEKVLSTESVAVEITRGAVTTAAKLADRYYRQVLPPEGAKALLARAATEIKIRSSEMTALHDERVKADTKIDPKDVVLALQKLTGIEVSPDEPGKFLQMEEKLKERVVGQDEPIEVVSDAIRRAKAGLKDRRRPIGAFIFMGPSGVGKTELARTLAWFLFDDEEAMIRLDMSEYQERHQIARMIGAPPGYIGYEEGGQLTEMVRKNPYSVIVFDEIEKAHPEVRNALLQIMEDGRLTDGHGRTIDFRNTVIIMTGNVGSEYFRAESEFGREKVIEAVQEEIKDTFRPEFLNRVDSALIFNSLTRENLSQIVDIQMKRFNEVLSEQKLSLQLTNNVKEFLAKEGYHPEYGARPLRRAIRRFIKTPLSKKILAQEVSSGDKVIADLKDEEIVFSKMVKEK